MHVSYSLRHTNVTGLLINIFVSGIKMKNDDLVAYIARTVLRLSSHYDIM